MNKYRNIPTVNSGIRFDSKAESRRYDELKLLLRAGLIRDLELQPAYPIVLNGVKVCVYRGDFRYYDITKGKVILEDVKSEATRINSTYRLKRKLVLAVYGIEIVEVS